jgi:hypothetical protein
VPSPSQSPCFQYHNSTPVQITKILVMLIS